jgi:phage terminase large subunit-like protein
MVVVVTRVGHVSVLERRKSEVSVLRDFECAGELVICEHLGDDTEQITKVAEQIDSAGLLYAVGLDPFGVGAIVDALAERDNPPGRIRSCRLVRPDR